MEVDKSRPKLSIVIPVYNERNTIEHVLRRIQAVDISKEIIVVDDGSTDGTREWLHTLTKTHSTPDPVVMTLPHRGDQLRTENIRVFFQDKNTGKGAALRRGFREAWGEIVLVQDADLEYDPRDYYKLLEPIERGMADGGVRVQVPGRTPSCPVLPALCRQQSAHDALEPLYESESERRLDLLQGPAIPGDR